MGNFDSIIGYKEVVKELEVILDIINNKEKYERLGAKIPKNIILEGPPGVGKTCMATSFIEGSHRKSYVLRKTKPDGAFVDEITKTIEEAMVNEPSIVLFDDLDKFSNDDLDRPDTDEFVVVQSMIDEAKDKDVFFIATVNNMRKLPRSLLRSQRMDRIIGVPFPSKEDAGQIINHYLSLKPYVDKLDTELLARLLNGYSCADLERIINEAAIICAYQDRDKIVMDDIIEATLRTIFDNVKSDKEKSEWTKKVCGIHEASHCCISEILEPNSVDLVSIGNYDSLTGGITSSYQADDYFYDINYMVNRIKVLLAGKAGVEVMLGKIDTGCNSDIHRAFDITERFVDNYCSTGFDTFQTEYSGPMLKDRKSEAVQMQLTLFYQSVKALVFKNKEFIEKVSNKLIEKGYILSTDIQEIKKTCTIVTE